MRTSSYVLDDLIHACEVMLDTHGFISHKTIGQQFGVTRQAIQLRLRRAFERGEITAEMCDRYHPADPPSTSREYSLAVTNDAFVQQQAELHQVRPSTIVDAALNRYRKTIC